MNAPQEITLDTVMSRRFELDEQIAVMEGQFKNQIAPLKEELTLCEQFVKSQMLATGLQQVKTAAGHQTFFTTKDSVTVEDWDAALAFIRKEEAWHLLNHAVGKTSVKEFIEVNNAPPPGVRYDSFKDLAWRRGKG